MEQIRCDWCEKLIFDEPLEPHDCLGFVYGIFCSLKCAEAHRQYYKTDLHKSDENDYF